MPQRTFATGQDWDSVNVGRSTVKKPIPKTAAGISAAKRAGIMGTEKRHGAGGNTSAHGGGVMSARKLEETDVLKHAKVDKSLSKAIMQARTAKKMSQKDLATAINEKPQVIAEYENGKAIPNGQIIVKIERKLGCKLPRPGKKKSSSAGSGGQQKSTPAGRSGVTRGGPPKRK
mmetsp:Transcript_19647/g.27632  ORF Transcript_19647/g.27632 Transcript_19647/m.27632 type:complete len:174 (+) Transcript_19647:72-593(+)|eukprot:CAMPEP_0184872184 /NCGR_PEP_ID=MMETSP0580-20130426/41139_1 /TAXON_ID=1118495 /ORGANISM="Dactyliosolen fragilissimus" /LENGTH=173 /DNA_ID=CAMNT_0027374937 /DNA_START=465 /DNA_END=986 /DNA_ORIENTATION=+